MTKKHFIALADAIKEHNKVTLTPYNRFNETHIMLLEDFCQSQNTRFNGARWVNYLYGKCGSNGGKVKEQKP